MDNELGSALRVARERAGLSVRQAAAAVNTDHGYLARIEHGTKKHPAAPLLNALAKTYDTDPKEFLKYIGVEIDLPEPRDYFERKLGVTRDEADFLAGLIEYQLHKPKGGTVEEADETRHEAPD